MQRKRKPGRPSLGNVNKMTVYLTDKDINKLTKKARLAGLSSSHIIRMLIRESA